MIVTGTLQKDRRVCGSLSHTIERDSLRITTAPSGPMMSHALVITGKSPRCSVIRVTSRMVHTG